MIALPRLALITPANGPEPSLASLAMLAGLRASDWSVQHFRSWARPWSSTLVGQISGLPGRHLDAWLMPKELCREVFKRGAREADLALVEGTLDPVDSSPPAVGCSPPPRLDRPGPIGPIIDALHLPRLAVVSCQDWQGVHLPWVPREADALLLDGLDSPERFHSLRSMIGLLTGKPVIGAIGSLPEIRSALADLPTDAAFPKEWVDPLAESFLRFADLPAIQALANSRPWPSMPGASPSRLPLVPHQQRLRVAYAMDAAFGGYFPDTLEALASLGAELIEFSPLRDGSLPRGADLVMIGCGCPDLHVEALAANHSLIGELRMHVCQGHRLYAEGSGTAYLCRTLSVDGRTYPGAGIFPFDAEFRHDWPGPEPVERVLDRDVWIGPKGTVVRGYQSSRWTFHPDPDLDSCPGQSGSLTDNHEIVFRRNAVGSLIHLHLGTLPQVVESFTLSRGASMAPRRL